MIGSIFGAQYSYKLITPNVLKFNDAFIHSLSSNVKCSYINASIDVSVGIEPTRALKYTNVTLRKQFFYSNKFSSGHFDRSFWSSSDRTITLSHSIISRCLNKRSVYAPTHRHSGLRGPHLHTSASNLPLYYIVSIAFFLENF